MVWRIIIYIVPNSRSSLCMEKPQGSVQLRLSCSNCLWRFVQPYLGILLTPSVPYIVVILSKYSEILSGQVHPMVYWFNITKEDYMRLLRNKDNELKMMADYTWHDSAPLTRPSPNFVVFFSAATCLGSPQRIFWCAYLIWHKFYAGCPSWRKYTMLFGLGTGTPE